MSVSARDEPLTIYLSHDRKQSLKRLAERLEMSLSSTISILLPRQDELDALSRSDVARVILSDQCK